MEVSLDQAIEIHARAMKQRDGRHAPVKAREIARQLASAGDREGHQVWLKVGEITEALLKDLHRVLSGREPTSARPRRVGGPLLHHDRARRRSPRCLR